MQAKSDTGTGTSVIFPAAPGSPTTLAFEDIIEQRVARYGRHQPSSTLLVVTRTSREGIAPLFNRSLLYGVSPGLAWPSIRLTMKDAH
jgi:hypothetical protein